MPPQSRHGRQPTFSKPLAAAFWLVAVGVVAVAAVAEERLALRLAVAAALSASLMIWVVYDGALREARKDYSHERTMHARSVGAAEDVARSREREITALRRRVGDLERQLAAATVSVAAPAARDVVADDLWDTSDAPTVVDMANRREARPIALVRDDAKRAAETA